MLSRLLLVVASAAIAAQAANLPAEGETERDGKCEYKYTIFF